MKLYERKFKKWTLEATSGTYFLVGFGWLRTVNALCVHVNVGPVTLDWWRDQLAKPAQANYLADVDVDHICPLPPLDFVDYGSRWDCPECGRRYVKSEADVAEGVAWWEPEER